MIEINLLPEELRKKEVPRLALPVGQIIKTVAIGFGVFLLAQLLFIGLVFYKQVELGLLDKQVADLRNDTAKIARMKSEITAVKLHLTQVQGLVERKFYWTQALNAISDSTTKGIWLRGFSLGQGEMPESKDKSRDKEKKEKEKRAKEKEAKEAKEEKSSKDKNSKEDKEKEKGKEKSKEKAVSSEKESAPRRHLRLEGSVVGSGEETALVGKFIKELKSNPGFSRVFERVELMNMTDRKIKDYDVYDFVLICVFEKNLTNT